MKVIVVTNSIILFSHISTKTESTFAIPILVTKCANYRFLSILIDFRRFSSVSIDFWNRSNFIDYYRFLSIFIDFSIVHPLNLTRPQNRSKSIVFLRISTILNYSISHPLYFTYSQNRSESTIFYLQHHILGTAKLKVSFQRRWNRWISVCIIQLCQYSRDVVIVVSFSP